MPQFLSKMSPLQFVCAAIGAAALVFGCKMTYNYGLQTTEDHAVILCLLAVAAALIWPTIDSLTNKITKKARFGFVAAGLFFVGVEFCSHFSYTTGHRFRDAENVAITNAVYDGSVDAVKDEKSNIEMWKGQLGTLVSERADLIKANGWAATVSYEALRAQIANMEGDAVYTRAKGCGNVTLKDSREFCDKYTALKVRLGTVEKANSLGAQIAAMTVRIDATQRVIDDKRATQATTKHVSSLNVSSASAMSKLATRSLRPSGDASEWVQIITGFIIACITTFLAPVSFKLAFAGVFENTNNGGTQPVRGHQTMLVRHELDEEGRANADAAARDSAKALAFRDKLRAATRTHLGSAATA
jgi:hypothetical protein